MKTTLREIIEEQMPVRSLIMVIVFIALIAGYGLWTTTDTGTLVVDSPLYEARVFVDEHSAGVLRDAPNSLRLSERAGTHTVIVSKNGYWPWTETVEIKKHETTELHPFLVPQKVSMESVTRLVFANGATGVNPEYTEAANLIENANISDEVLPLVEATRIEGVTHADFAPGRTDVIIIAAKDGIFAVGVEKDERPNFQPIYKGENPSFVKTKDNALYIKDGDSISLIRNLRI
jgi:hypothetical protein